MSHLVLVDGNSMGFSAMGSPHLSTGDKKTHGTLAFIKRIRTIYLDNPGALVLILWDGRSWRKDLTAEYKAKREKAPKAQEQRQEYYDQKPDMQKALRLLGCYQCFADNMEADDLAEIYARQWKGDKVTLVTGDQDWLQLVDHRVTWYDPIRERVVTDANFVATTGYKDSAQFVEAKSVLGDKDEVPGIKGIGPKILDVIYTKFNMSFRSFLDTYLGWPDEVEEQWLEYTGKKLPKILKDNATADTFVKLAENDKLGDLRTPHRPEPINLKRSKKPLDVAGFEDFCYSLGFLSITRGLEAFMKPIVHNKYT